MISFLVRLRFLPEDRERVSATLRALTVASRQEPGCVSYIPHEAQADPCVILIYEQYRDAAALDAHRNSPHFREHAIGGLYQWMLERSVEDLTALA